jgi:pilus assembly protein CpaB
LKRSNRLVLLIGVFLAIVAFIGVLVWGPGPSTETPVTEFDTVVAAVDIPLGVQVTADMVTEIKLPQEGRSPTAFGDTSLVLGRTVRQFTAKDAQLTAETFGDTGTGSTMDDIAVPPGRRAITVQVDQVTGVGTVIKTGDFVDMVIGIRADKFPVITTNPADDTFTVVSGINGTSVKLLLQGMQVLGTLLPPPPAQAQGQEPQPGQGGTALTGQQEIVALSVDAQQAEVIKFAQMDAEISLVLRATEDFIDPATGQLLEPQPLPDATTGIILKSLVDRYGVLPPELIETVLPAQARR